MKGGRIKEIRRSLGERKKEKENLGEKRDKDGRTILNGGPRQRSLNPEGGKL